MSVGGANLDILLLIFVSQNWTFDYDSSSPFDCSINPFYLFDQSSKGIIKVWNLLNLQKCVLLVSTSSTLDLRLEVHDLRGSP